ncbi:MAG: ABC transporter ATP-binding protein [Pseudonocardiales bacterium]|nr:ABC transporter ATP-binding protein [Pseudonocardiales bacterium]
MSSLAVENVTVRFRSRSGTVTAVDRVSFEIADGQAVGLVGESGSGKSTLARAIVGLAPIHGGRIEVDGQDVTHRSGAMRRRLGKQVQIIFQDPDTALDPRMTVRQSLLEGATAFVRLDRAAREAKVVELLGLVGLDDGLASVYPRELSGGQRQRIAIARALAVDPGMLIADEITSALDVSVQGAVLNVIQQLRARLGLSMLFIGHNLAAVRYVSDVIAVMYLGQIVEVAPTDQLLNDPQHPYTRALLESIPRLGQDVRGQDRWLAAEQADPTQSPAGCRFHLRCPVGPSSHADRTICCTADPAADAADRDHRAACHFAGTTV